jgi:hypothetical protein
VLRAASWRHARSNYAQIETALTGIGVTHLDSHMGTVLLDPFVGIYVKLLRSTGCRCSRRIPIQTLERAGLGAFVRY